MADRRINYRVTTDSRQAQQQFDRLDNKVKTIGTNLRNVAGMFGVAFGATALFRFVKGSIDLFNKQEQAEKKLEVALGRTSQALLDHASALQKQTTFGDESIIEAQALIGAFVKEEEAIKRLTEATLDLAVAKGMDLVAAADLVSKTVGSSTNALSRYGIQVEGAVGSTERLNSTIENIARIFGGQAKAQTETLGGQLEQLENRFGDLREKLVVVLIPALNSLLDSFENLIKITEKLFDKDYESSGFIKALKLMKGYAPLLNIGVGSQIRYTEEQIKQLRNAGLGLQMLSPRDFTPTTPDINNFIPDDIDDINAEFETTIGIVNRANERIAELTEKIKFAESKTEIRKLAREIASIQNEVNSLTTIENAIDSQIEKVGILTLMYGDMIDVISKGGVQKQIGGGIKIPIQLESVEVGGKPTPDLSVTMQELQELYWGLDLMSIAAAQTLMDEFNKAWRSIFGEANSLFEKFMMNLSSAISNLATQYLANSIFSFVGSAIGLPGLGATASGGATTINLRIGQEDFQAVVNTSLPAAYNRAVRLRKI